MKISITREFEVKFYNTLGISFGKFKQTRAARIVSSEAFEKCFICQHKFKNDDFPVVLQVDKLGNKLACRKCYEHYI